MSNIRNHKASDSTPMTAATAERLMAALESKYPGKVWRVVECCPVAIVKTIDNEEDALVTLMNIERTDALKAALLKEKP
jgi:hypothetical protein